MKICTFDIETWGLKPGYTLQPWRVSSNESGLLSCACYRDGQDCILFNKVEELKEYFNALDKKTILCGWNLCFDLSFLIALGLGPILKRFKYLDGMLLLKRMGVNYESYGLKNALKILHFKLDFRSLNIQYEPNYEKEVDFKVGMPNDAYSKDELEKIWAYNEQDTLYTHAIIKYLLLKADIKNIKQAIRESTISLLFAASWDSGIYLSKEQLDSCTKELNNKIHKLNRKLSVFQLTPRIIASPQQLQRYLLTTLGITLAEKTVKGAFSVSRNVLNNLYYNSTGVNKTILRLIRGYKKLVTEKSKFITSAKECLIDNECIHPQPMMAGTYTGRLTYSMYTNFKEVVMSKKGKAREIARKLKIGIPIHQIKKKADIRNIFIAPKGYSLLELDFSNQEMRLMACLAEEKTMIKLFNENKDLHAFTGAGILGIPYEDFLDMKNHNSEKYKEMRNLGKLTNLALQYRLSANSLYRQWHDVYGLTNKSLDDAVKARETYLKLYKGVADYWNKMPLQAKKQGYAINKSGRRVALLDWKEDIGYKSAQTAINFPIQSLGADQKILALYSLFDFLDINDIKLAWDLHDGLFFYIPKCDMQIDLAIDMINIMNDLPYEKLWGWKPQVKFPVEAKIGDSWGSLQLINYNGG
jgi:DNA polymerase I-like protein with 3'-5' exonuclease and polymerase domains